MITIAAIVLTLQSFDFAESAQRRNVKLAVSEASKLYGEAQQIPEAERGELFFRVSLTLDEILSDHPRSLEAAVLKKGKLLNTAIDVAMVRRSAETWERANPSRARDLRAGVQVPGVRKSPTRDPVETPPKDKTVVPPVVQNDGDRKITLPPRVRNVLKFPTNTPIIPPVQVKPPAHNTSPARKWTPQQVLRAMRRATVLLMFVVDDGEKLTPYHLGTGFFITPDVILTNSHVAGASGNASGFWLAINEYIGVREAQLIARADKETIIKIDAAAMRVMGFRSENFLRFNENYEIDEWIAISGYPGKATAYDIRYDKLKEAIQKKVKPEPDAIPTAVTGEGRINNHFVDSVSRATNLQYTMTTAGGNSGSPIANACAEVVGLHYSGTKTFVTKDTSSGSLVVNPSKYNQSIATREVLYFLRTIGIDIETERNPCEVGG